MCDFFINLNCDENVTKCIITALWCMQPPISYAPRDRHSSEFWRGRRLTMEKHWINSHISTDRLICVLYAPRLASRHFARGTRCSFMRQPCRQRVGAMRVPRAIHGWCDANNSATCQNVFSWINKHPFYGACSREFLPRSMDDFLRFVCRATRSHCCSAHF